MSDRFSFIPIDHLYHWILTEYEQKEQVFGIHKSLFFRPDSSAADISMERYGEVLESPIGVAAGPHSQMAQNIMIAWLCGARFIELKTVQTLDEIDVSKPCIDMEDEGYNCEWSQELRLKESFEEYLKAWILIHALKRKWGLGEENRGFLFNMSVGYNLEGILKDNVQRFFQNMRDCSALRDEMMESLVRMDPELEGLNIPSRISDNITLSTMHGCPPEEIEKIGMYLVEELKLHTAIKMNPTLLGPDRLRDILNQKLGYPTDVPDLAFEHDLKFQDAVRLIQNLSAAAKRQNVSFGLKLTNTLECRNHRDVFSPGEEMMYMSGRALHPISIHVAARLQEEFQGELDLSFCAGVDCFNISDVLSCGLKPVTVCSDILKPGGYGRMAQYLENTIAEMERSEAGTLDEFLLKSSGMDNLFQARVARLNSYGAQTLENPMYHKSFYTGEKVKTGRELVSFDCVKAPCVETCPAEQDIPLYMHFTARKEYEKAFEVIARTNPFPGVCGMVCDHLCEIKCTRMNYDTTLLIREIKRFVTERAGSQFQREAATPLGLKVGIIGGGPSGLSCAYFLAQEGFEVHVFERKSVLGGMMGDAIPVFRLSSEALERDLEKLEKMGVVFHLNYSIDEARFEKMRRDYDYIYIGVGAQEAKKQGIEGESAQGVHDFLEFLSSIRKGQKVPIGKRVLVIGGGNSAMDVARTAHRLVGEDGKVTVVYRRSIREMPADRDEVAALLEEDIEVLELTAPTRIVVEDEIARSMECRKMELGEPDDSGRARPIPIEGSEFLLDCDSIIPAIGQNTVLDFLPGKILETDPVTNQTTLEKVYAGGDAVRGPSTLIKAIGDGRDAAHNMMKAARKDHKLRLMVVEKGLDTGERQVKSATRSLGQTVPKTPHNQRQNFHLVHPTLEEDVAVSEANRCLYCDDVCDVCVSVCPNRSNLSYQVIPDDYPIFRAVGNQESTRLVRKGTFRLAQESQVLNIGDFCNECANCTTFCPTSGNPYKDKPKFYLTRASFDLESSGFFLEGPRLFMKRDGEESVLEETDQGLRFHNRDIQCVLDEETLNVSQARLLNGKGTVELDDALEMGILYRNLKNAWFQAPTK